MKKFCVTFDVDLTDYLSGNNSDEMDECFDTIKEKLSEYPEVKTTWFIRIDKQIESIYGTGDYIFTRHREKLRWLTDNGHELGWHYHGYKLEGGSWVQNVDEDEIAIELEKYAGVAIGYNLRISRMGWGFHTGKTLKRIYSLGFETDSSAIPRPVYSWEKNIRDWSITPNSPYYPGENDYRTEMGKKIGILEVPINTAYLKLDTDTENVKRYINVGYKHKHFKKAIETLSHLPLIVSVTHPYELVVNEISHPLLSFDISEFGLNLQFLLESQFAFITMSNINNENFN
ncbi:hypothetical protein [Daejeonella sp. JGW-45]|uniref:hypothetical protein n=1 Tax=Daejeonella sp. JGW-45 TaxID=3034148 RepID=UPI0023ECDA1A|nr:hypothetical protein [Daejeonella sp. JGW-45]